MTNPEAWGWLAGSLVVAVLLDFAAVRLLAEFLRPASVYAFYIARGAKLATLLAWMAFFNNFWYPQFLSQGQPPSDLVKVIQTGVVVAFLALAALTLPRGRRVPDA